MEKKINIGKEAKVRVNWKTPSMDYSKEMEKNIRVAFANKYNIPVSNVEVNTIFVNTNVNGEVSLNDDTIQNIQDPKFHQYLYKEWLAVKGIENYDMDEILKIDSQINALIDFDSYDKGRKYCIKWLDWDNFLSYGPNNHIDFTDLNGLILLNSIPANQGGKSTFAYDLLHFLFFGKTRSGKMDTLNDLFNRHIPEATTVKVEGCLNIDGSDYIIRRTLNRPALSSKSKTRNTTQKVEYFRVLSDGNYEELADCENLNEATNVQTSKAIKEAIGGEKDFDLVISANADNLKDLISLKDTDRGRLLTRWIGLLPIEDKDIKARDKWNKEISKNRYCDKYNRESLSNEIVSFEENSKEIAKEIEKNEKIAAECIKKIEGFNKTKETLLSSKKIIDQSLLKIDVYTLEKSIKDITEDGLNTKIKKEKEEAKLKEMGEPEEFDISVYNTKVKEKETLIVNITNIKNNIINLRSMNKQLAESEYCPTCKRKLENVDNSGTIAENEKKIDELTQEGILLNNKLTNIKGWIENSELVRQRISERNKVELLISKFNVELSNLREQLIEKKNLLKEINNNKEAIAKNNEIDNSLNIVNVNINNEENIRRRVTELNVSYAKDIEQNKREITNRNLIISKIEEEVKIEKNWKLYLTMVGKDGISKMVLRKTLPIINSELKRLLDDVCDFEVEVTMDDKNDVDFIMVCKNDGVRQKLSAGSGFEQTAASLALRVVLGNMSALSKPPFLLLDEVLGGVAKENYDNMKKLYTKISATYGTIFQITHLTDIVDWHDKVLTIVKDNKGISKIEK